MEQTVDLECHPETPAPTVRGIRVRVLRTSAGDLELGFRLEGDPGRIRVPPPRPPRFVEGLWRHTCFEVFVAPEEGFAYREWNFAPSGEWAAYAFRAYRDGGPLGEERFAPRITARVDHQGLELDARLALASIVPELARGALRIGLSAVIESDDGALSFWALRHPPGQPDFHDAGAFALRLEAARHD